MGKKRIVKKRGESVEEQIQARIAKARAKSSKKKLHSALVHISSSYNNTLIALTYEEGNAVFQSSSGAMGFRGSKKGTPYAATRAAEDVASFAQQLGVKDIDIRIKGIGSGRETVIRFFVQKGFNVRSIKDLTPIPHGIPRLPKPRRV